MEVEFELRRKNHWYTYIGDFLNTLKAFIGTNYQALPFAFANSGVALGIAGVFVVATTTDHCCQMIVRSKSIVVERKIKHELERGRITENEVEALRERFQFSVGYGDVAKQVFGPWCYHVTQAAVCFTQFVCCLAYFVFIANTFGQMFPLKEVEVCGPTANGTLISRQTVTRVRTELQGIGVPMLSIPSVSYNFSARHRRSAVSCNISGDLVETFQPHVNDLNRNLMSFGENEKLVESQQSLGDKKDFAEIWNLESGNGTIPCNITKVETAPDLRIIVLFPLPIFILTSLVRNVRYLAPFSSIATVALAAGALSVLGFLIDEFHVGPFDWYKVHTLPLFICQLISSYEGIGCILPIQSSMVGCRHLFPAYLHANIYIIFVILCTFGTLGYMRYGDNVKQIIVLEIPQHVLLSILVDITLIISVIFTYPIQCYPVIQIMEGAILIPGNRSKKNAVGDAEVSTEGPRDELLARSQSIDSSVSEVATMAVPSTVAIWKRNVLRVVITLITCGLAVILRDYFAYLTALSGALGASFLAFILPCLIDIKLRYAEISRLALIKNVCIVVITIIVSVLGFIITMIKVVQGFPT